ncbi:unnamed protein product [Psylliodes chrysocephalus]|uniref:Uncharacterized protein n=1 Tax=Psylliodes chrysocephalus TaxID=3402493 RepID=A0A9P0D2A4_9CUCU|nr:unnamed protein product [Psylliodes chrysocephala]
MASFRATGIAPFDPKSVLRKIPSANLEEEPDQVVNNVLVEYLQQQRFAAVPSRQNVRRQKLVVESGKSVSAPVEEDSDSQSSDSSTNSGSSSSGTSENENPESIITNAGEVNREINLQDEPKVPEQDPEILSLLGKEPSGSD